MDELIKKIIDKKDLNNLPNKIVLEKLEKHLTPKIKTKYEELGTRFFRSKEFTILKKQVRNELREIYGVFYEKGDRNKLLNELIKNPSTINHLKLLELHKSSKERIPYYDIIYKKIFAITGKPKTILDLASGYNAFSYPFMNVNAKIISVDLSDKDASFIQQYYDRSGINGTAIALDLTKETSLKHLRDWKVDVCFLFKALDSIESVKRNFSKELLEAINAKYTIISFPTKSLGGKKEIKTERRKWLEKKFTIQEKFELANEIFYIIN